MAHFTASKSRQNYFNILYHWLRKRLSKVHKTSQNHHMDQTCIIYALWNVLKNIKQTTNNLYFLKFLKHFSTFFSADYKRQNSSKITCEYMRTAIGTDMSYGQLIQQNANLCKQTHFWLKWAVCKHVYIHLTTTWPSWPSQNCKCLQKEQNNGQKLKKVKHEKPGEPVSWTSSNFSKHSDSSHQRCTWIFYKVHHEALLSDWHVMTIFLLKHTTCSTCCSTSYSKTIFQPFTIKQQKFSIYVMSHSYT